MRQLDVKDQGAEDYAFYVGHVISSPLKWMNPLASLSLMNPSELTCQM